MTRRTAIPAVLAALALVASTACTNNGADKGSAGANPTVATDPPRTNPTLATLPPPTTTTNPYAVPAVIDAAYVNRIMASLDGVMGDATRSLIRSRTITAEVYDRLRAIYANNSLLQLVVDAIEDEIRKNFSGYKPNPGNRVTTATSVIATEPGCIFVRVQRNYSAMSPESKSPDPQWVALRPLEQVRDPQKYNPTSWAMIYDGFTRDRSQPENPCSR